MFRFCLLVMATVSALGYDALRADNCPFRTNERDFKKLPIKNRGLASGGKGSREQASLLARPESALCARTGRGKKETLPAIFTVAGGYGPVSLSEFSTLSSISMDSFLSSVLFLCFFSSINCRSIFGRLSFL